MRILQVNTSDISGGAEKVMWQLHQRLKELGHDSVLAVGNKNSNDPDVFLIDNRLKPLSPSWIQRRAGDLTGVQYVGFPASHRLPELVGEAWDVAVLHNLHGGYFDLAAIPRLAKIAPVILNLHDMWLLTGHCAHPLGCDRWEVGCGDCCDLTLYPEISFDLTRFNLKRKRRILSGTNVRISSPARWLLDLADRTYLAPFEKRHIQNSVDLSLFQPGDKEAARRRLGLPTGHPIVLFPAKVGIQNPWKDFDMLLSSVRLIADLNPLVVSFGSARWDTRDIDVNWYVAATVTDSSVMADHYRAADVVVYPSRAETSPLTLLEAMACGTPAVATDVGGVGELIEDGRTGHLVQPGDASALAARLRAMLTEPELMRAMAVAGRAVVEERHDLTVVTDLWLEWFGELARERSGAG